MKKLMQTAASGVLLVWAFVGGTVVADPEAEAKYRHDVMEAIGGHMSSMGVILRNGIHGEDLLAHAEAISAMAKIAPNIFPEGSKTAESDALDAIWEDPEGFNEALEKFGEAADGMAVAAKTGDMGKIGAAIKALGGSCKGCHDNYSAE